MTRTYRALLRQTLYDHRRAPLYWGGALGAMSALIVAIWPSIEDSVSELIRQYPEGLRQAFGIGALDSVEEYVDAEMLSLIVPLALCVFAIRCASRAIAGAEDRGYLDTLLALPVSRSVLVAATASAIALLVAAILFVTWALTWLTGLVVGSGLSAGRLAEGMFNVWPLSMAFAGLALAAAGLLHRPGPVTAVASGVVVGMYVIDLAGKLDTEIEALRTISAFRYYGSAIQNGLDLSHVAGLTLAGALLAALGAWLFERRDVL